MLPFKIMGHCTLESLFLDLMFLMINSENILLVCYCQNRAIGLKLVLIWHCVASLALSSKPSFVSDSNCCKGSMYSYSFHQDIDSSESGD